MKITKLEIYRLFAAVLLITLYFFISIKDLYVDVINPDGINWHKRTQTFTDALSKRRYSETFQTYHPGTTLMWVSGPVLNTFKGNSNIESDMKDPKATFLERDYYAKLSVVTFGTLLYILILVVLWKLIGFKYAAFYSVFYILEPFDIGMRRIYHLDFLMTTLLFLSFLLILYFNFKSPKWLLIIFSGLFYSLSLLTKATAIILLPVIPFIFLMGKNTLLKKLCAILLFILSSLVFMYVFFPPLWKNPIKSAPKYYDRIVFGITDIGVEGKKEMGTSGKSKNITLDETFKEKGSNFYISSLLMRFSVAGGILLITSVGVFIYFFLKDSIRLIWDYLKNRNFPKGFSTPLDSWTSFWSIGISIAILIALTLSVKKSDRYLIIVFPFLIAVVASFFNKLKVYFSIPLLILYICFVSLELNLIHPYYLAYSNPLLGGIETRLRLLDDDPFGIGSYAAFDIVKKDRETSGYSGYYTVSGTKSIKAISAGGRFSRFPSCVTDYVISYALEEHPTYSCTQKYVLVDTVKINDFDYWYVYKRLNQKHESNHE